MPRFLHTGDIHLDSPFAALDETRAEVRRNELRAAFTSVLTYARMNDVDVILIAGDCFDSKYATRDTIALMRDGFESLPRVKIVVSPGNHDPFTPDSVWAKTTFPANVTVFSESTLSRVSFDDINTDVYGYAFTSPSLTSFPAERRRVSDPSRINILCAHAEMDAPLSDNCPVTEKMLADFGADYAALGHIHRGGINGSANGMAYAYCGCLEGRDFGETGYKGAIVLDADKHGTDCDIRARRVRFSKRRYECLTVDVGGAKTNVDVKNAVAAAVNGRFGEDTVLRITLTGAVDPSLTVSRQMLEGRELGLFASDICDETAPSLGTDYLENDVSVRGELYRRLLPAMRDGTPEERRVAKAAFRYAMSALDGGNLT